VSKEPQTMGPGYVPHSATTAREFLRRLEERQAAMIGPYVARSMDSQAEARADMPHLEGSFRAAGLPPEALERVDWEATTYMSALAEAITDLMHLALKEGMQIQGCWAMAAEKYNRQSTALTRYLAYGAPDDPEPRDTLDVVPE